MILEDQKIVVNYTVSNPVFLDLYAPANVVNNLSLHDALPISHAVSTAAPGELDLHPDDVEVELGAREHQVRLRSEEHTSELQSPYELVCRLLLEKKKR